MMFRNISGMARALWVELRSVIAVLMQTNVSASHSADKEVIFDPLIARLAYSRAEGRAEMGAEMTLAEPSLAKAAQ